ncbi:MAG TPA: hypothetical protein V6D34_04975 [Candidatus Sericytochromatia bacterium]|jgi:hypothetical protein
MVQTVPRKKRDEVRTNYRLEPDVKKQITDTADEDGRSENMQAEYLIRLGLEYRQIKKAVGR